VYVSYLAVESPTVAVTPLANPLTVAKPSDSGTEQRIKPVTLDGKPGNVFDSATQLQLLLSVYANNPDEACNRVASAMVNMITRFRNTRNLQLRDACGVFRCEQTEQALTSVLAPILASLFPQYPEVLVCHQLFSRAGDDAKPATPSAPMDITILKECEGCLIPTCLLEVAVKDPAEDKRAQGFAYSQNCFSHYYPKNCLNSMLVVLLSANLDLQLRFVYDAGDGKRFTDLLMFSSLAFDVEQLARVLSGVRWWTNQFRLPTALSTDVNSARTANCNVARRGAEVLKLYDYKCRGFELEHQRSPTLLIDNEWLPDAKV
jgi:hypothetical protein